MPYVGRQNVTGEFIKLDAITTSATNTFNLLRNGAAFSPATAEQCIVSVNGVTQAPQDAFNISGSQIVFTSTLSANDVIDYILVMGNALSAGVPSDGSVSTAKIANTSVTNAKIADSTIDLTSKVTGILPTANGGTGFSTRPAFATTGTNYTQTNNAYSIIIPNAETFDTGNNYNASTGVFTTPVNGLYMFGFWGLSYPHTAHANAIAYHKNGSIVGQNVQFNGTSTQHEMHSGSIILELVVNDTIDLRYHQNSSSSGKAYSTQWNMYGYLIG